MNSSKCIGNTGQKRSIFWTYFQKIRMESFLRENIYADIKLADAPSPKHMKTWKAAPFLTLMQIIKKRIVITEPMTRLVFLTWVGLSKSKRIPIIIPNKPSCYKSS